MKESNIEHMSFNVSTYHRREKITEYTKASNETSCDKFRYEKNKFKISIKALGKFFLYCIQEKIYYH